MPNSPACPDLLACLARPATLAALPAVEWDRLLPQAREAGMLASLWSLLGQQGAREQVPPAVRAHLFGAALVARHHSMALGWELDCLRGELPDCGPDGPILLKGAAYLAAGLPHAELRLCSDIDILVDRGRLAVVEQGLYWQGWLSADLGVHDQRYYRQWMHQLPPMQHRRRGSTLDVHHNILPVTARRPPQAERLTAAAVAAPGGARYALLSPAHMVIHCATHRFADSEWDRAARDFYDLDQLLRHYAERDGAAFWTALVGETRALERGRELFYTLRYCRRWLATPVPAEVVAALDRWRPGLLLLALMDWVFRAAVESHAGGTRPRVTTLCRALLLVRSHWLKMPPLLLLWHLLHKALRPRARD